MSGALDDDAARTLASGRQTVGSMLSAAQTHLKKVFFVFVIGMMLTIWGLRTYVWDRLKLDLVYNRMDAATAEATEIIAVTPFDVILLQVKIGLVVGILVSIPVLLWYSRDSLRRRGIWPDEAIPRWKIVGFVIAVTGLFIGGVLYAYYLFFPLMFEFLASNANNSGFKPTWSIVLWTEFIFFLMLSFGIAAQLPLAMSSMARTGIVPYETFRNKWRYAIVAIFMFGAMFSPPDPFTQVMWGVPLVGLYAISLGVTRIAVLSKRTGEQVSARAVARTRWNQLAGVLLIAGAATYMYLQGGGLAATNEALDMISSSYRFPLADELGAFGLSSGAISAIIAAVAGLVDTAIVLFYFQVLELERLTDEAEAAMAGTASQSAADSPTQQPDAGEPAEIDIGAMNARAIRATSIEAFESLSEVEVLEYAEQAVEDDNPEKAQAIFDRYDELQEREEEKEEEQEKEESTNPVTSTAAGVVDSFTEEETDEDDIGGYYYDIAFILDSLTSKAIWLVGTFMVVMVGTFLFLYSGGIGKIRDLFLGSMPAGTSSDVQIVALHPVEALLFMLKFSTLLGVLATVPILLYFAWPAIEERDITSGDRNILPVWGGSLFVTLIGGSLLGFLYIAPTIISALAYDVVTSNMVIAYRINSFGWLVIFLTVGIGFLAMVPVTMLLFNHGNIISYYQMRKRWRVVVLGFFAAAGFLSPKGVFTMFIIGIPASLAYGLGLGLVWLYARLSRSRSRDISGEAAD